jgi:murein L,D-transpeptidase YafK
LGFPGRSGIFGTRPPAWRGAAGPLQLVQAVAWAGGSDVAAAGPEPLQSAGAAIHASVRRERKADRVVVYKADRSLLLLRGKQVLRAYRVALGASPDGPKVSYGDGRTPEGAYLLDWRKEDSEFYRALHISYPNAADRERARALGLAPGGGIMIHGLPNHMAGIEQRSHASGDWTNGCIAVTNREMDEIWTLVSDGTPIEIRP